GCGSSIKFIPYRAKCTGVTIQVFSGLYACTTRCTRHSSVYHQSGVCCKVIVSWRYGGHYHALVRILIILNGIGFVAGNNNHSLGKRHYFYKVRFLRKCNITCKKTKAGSNKNVFKLGYFNNIYVVFILTGTKIYLQSYNKYANNQHEMS